MEFSLSHGIYFYKSASFIADFFPSPQKKEMLPSANTSSPIFAYSVYCPYSNLHLFVPLTSPSTIWYCLDFCESFLFVQSAYCLFPAHFFSWHADITPTKKHIVPLGIKNAWESNIHIQQLVILLFPILLVWIIVHILNMFVNHLPDLIVFFLVGRVGLEPTMFLM